MLRSSAEQRAVLAQKVPDLTNLITAAIVIGFFFGEPGASPTLLGAVLGTWAAGLVFAVTMTARTMTEAIILMAGAVAIAWCFYLYDWIARRRERQTKGGPG